MVRYTTAGKLSESEAGQNGHGVDDVDSAQQEGDQPAALEQILQRVAAVAHDHGNCGGSHRSQESGKGTCIYQQNQTDGVSTQCIGGQQANGNEYCGNAAVQHELSQDERDDEEHCAKNVAVVSAAYSGCKSISDEVAGTGSGEGRAESQSADIQHQHIPGNVAKSSLGINYAEQAHQQAAAEGNAPGGQTEFLGEDQAEDGSEEDDDADGVNKRTQLAVGVLRFLFQCFDRNGRLVGSELGSQEQCPYRNYDQDGPCADGEINGTHGDTGETVGLHEAGELAGLLNGGGQRKNAAACYAGNHDGEQVLGTALAGLIQETADQGAYDRVNDHGAGDEVGEQNGQQQIAEVCGLEGTAGDLGDTVDHLAYQAGAAESGSNHEHGSHQDGVDIGETDEG